jgi:hypothetical protein
MPPKWMDRMDENTPSAGTENGQQTGTETVPTVESLQVEVDKWKTLSRTNEKRWNDASAELDRIRRSQVPDAEEALEAARAEARSAALSEIGPKLADAELRAHAAKTGVELPSAEYLNLGVFVADDGSVNADAIGAFVSSLPKPATAPEFMQGLGLGRTGSAGSDISTMDPTELADLIAGGSFI